MADILFFEKPGCRNNTRQKRLLETAGHALRVENLLTYAWTKEQLLRFYGGYRIHECVNPVAPRITSGEIDPANLSEDELLEEMLRDPLLIRRPLMQSGQEYRVGFDMEQVQEWVGLDPQEDLAQNVETCTRSITGCNDA